MSEFEHDGHQYRIKKLNAIEQWHVNRRIAPLVPRLVPAFVRVSSIAGGGDKKGAILKDLNQLSQLIAPFADAVAGMSNDDSEFVINTCLSAVSRQVAGDTWQKVWIPASKISPFAELNDIMSLLPLVMRVIWDSLGPFILAQVTASDETAVTSTEEG